MTGSTLLFLHSSQIDITLNTRSRFILFLILVLPLILLAWLGQRSLIQDRIVAEHQASELADARLRQAQGVVHGFINELEQSAITALSFLQIADSISDENITLIRQVINTDPFLDHVFVLNSDRELVFPQDTAIYSNAERQFVTSFAEVLSDPNAFRLRSKADVIGQSSSASSDLINSHRYEARREGLIASLNRSKNINETVASTLSDSSDTPPRVEAGWTTWDTGTATDVYLWHRTSSDVLVGQKLSSAYWLSQLIVRLGTSLDAGGLVNATIRLVDKRQRTIYQAGEHLVRDNLDGDVMESPLSKEWLTYPLDGWRLEYFAPATPNTNFKLFVFLSSFLCLLALVFIGVRLVWREYQQKIHTAEQRVSFVNQVSHELKTPLTNICIYADMLETEANQDEHSDPARVSKFAKVVTSESQRLSRLINNVLNFSRAQQQKISVHKTLVSPDELILLTLDNFAPAFESKGIHVETDLAISQTVMLDAELLEQILNNLFSNVEKYAAQGGLAKVVSSFTGNTVTVLVSDRGEGIPLALRSKIFEPFERGSDSLIEGVSGTGIGLSIARDLARLHGGDLSLIDSIQGACFELTLKTEVFQ